MLLICTSLCILLAPADRRYFRSLVIRRTPPSERDDVCRQALRVNGVWIAS